MFFHGHRTRARQVIWEEWFCEKVLFLTLLISSKPSLLPVLIFVLTTFIRYRYRDYTHGLITTAVHVLPVLRTDTEEAAIASNCVLNTGAFRDDGEFIHT